MSDFLDSLEDNAALVSTAWADVWNPSNWLSGSAPLTAAEVKRQLQERGQAVDPTSAAGNGGVGGLALIGQATKETVVTVVTDPGAVVDAGLNGTADSPGGLLGGARDALKLVPWWAWVVGGVAVVGAATFVALPYIGGAKAVLS